jgi:hypothetical protein
VLSFVGVGTGVISDNIGGSCVTDTRSTQALSCHID